MSKEDIIVDLLKELKADHKELSGKSSEHREETLSWQGQTSIRLEAIEKDLREHKEGVINNRALIKTANQRLELLEKPRVVFNFLKNGVISTGKVVTAITVISGAVIYFLKDFL